MKLSSFIKKVNNLTNKAQKLSSKLSVIDRSLKNIANATAKTDNKNKVAVGPRRIATAKTDNKSKTVGPQ